MPFPFRRANIARWSAHGAIVRETCGRIEGVMIAAIAITRARTDAIGTLVIHATVNDCVRQSPVIRRSRQ
jgi:hypothetical protein